MSRTKQVQYNHFGSSDIKKTLGITLAEFKIVVAILSHKKVFGDYPTRAAVVSFLKNNVNGYRLERIGWIIPKKVGPVAGQYLTYWQLSDTALKALE